MDAVLHINDIALLLANHDSEHISPGYALINGDEIAFGYTASQLHRLYPNNTHNNFWLHLDQNPIQTHSKHIRHNADLAYMHLSDIKENIANISNCLVAVPSNYGSDELALLLGLLNAAEFNNVKIIDSALLASSLHAKQGKYTYIDLQLHQTVFTLLESNSNISIADNKSIQNVSMLVIEKTIEKIISDELINQARFDSHHNAETEQLVYNKLPELTSALSANSSYGLEVEYEGHTHQAIIQSDTIEQALHVYYQTIKDNVDESSTFILNHYLHSLPGCKDFFRNAVYIEQDALFKNTQYFSSFIKSTSNELNYLNSLPNIDKNAQEQTLMTSTNITHILIENHAVALNQTQLDFNYYGIYFSDNHYWLQVLDKNTILINNKEVNADIKLSLGDEITVNNKPHTSRLIRVD